VEEGGLKLPVLSTKEFVIYLEENNGFFFIHCDVNVTWSKKVKRKLQIAFDMITKNWEKELYAIHTPNDKKHEKFLKMFNFNFFKKIEGLDGNDYHIYVWR
jgi:hypothetical protein